MEPKHYEQLGKYVRNLCKIEDYEDTALGFAMYKAFVRVQLEAERDARDKANGKGVGDELR